MIWLESGGSGDCTILLLHGLGATAAVWSAVRRALAERGSVRWIAPDLCGHGDSPWRSSYSVGGLAGELAEHLRDVKHLFVVGHSLGAYVGLALASGWFGVRVEGVVAIGPKIHWSEADLMSAHQLATRPVRAYATDDEAWARYRRVSGLTEDIAAGPEALARGVLRSEEGWRLAQDPGTFAVAGAPFDSLVACARAQLIAARGEHDPMVARDELCAHVRQVHDIRGSGHNVHVQNPPAVLALLEPLLQGG